MNRFAAVILSIWVALAGALSAHAQSVTTIYSFYGTLDGASPRGSLTVGPDGNLYGTTFEGADRGGQGNGTVFRVTTNGLLTVLINFNDNEPGLPFVYGANCYANLTLGPDGNFYGTAWGGGSSNNGTIFKLMTNGNATTLVMFNGTNGANPMAGLTLGPDGNLYGTTAHGGSAGLGIVFKVTTNGTLTTLANFDGTNALFVNNALTLGPDGNFYDTTPVPFGGTVFQVTTNGTFTTLVDFYNNEPSYGPGAGLTLGPDGNFYGTTENGGSSNSTVFELTTNGVLTTLAVNTNGALPNNLTLGPDGNFYGTTAHGGSAGQGTVFKVTTNGILTTLASFNGTNGAIPVTGLTLGPDGNFYGVTDEGGTGGGYGTIFRLNLPPDFITAPANQTVTIGGSATLNCQIFGTAPFAYQWLSNGVPITGATNASLNFNPVLANEIGTYQLVVTNAYGSVTSQPVSLNVPLPLKISAISNLGGGTCTLYLQGQPTSTNRLWMTTNLSLDHWQVIATNITDSNGLAQFLDTNTAGMPQKFYRLSYP